MISLLLACTEAAKSPSESQPVHDSADSSTDSSTDTSDSTEDRFPTGDPFADAVISFSPGEGAGYGQDSYPTVVLGSPEAPGTGGGSLDVLSLGKQGEIVLAFTDYGLVDGEGPDLLVFENPFTGWYEPGRVAVSDDGINWMEWPCDPADASGVYPGCAGVALVYANSSNGIDPTDPATAGGDAFDLADLGITQARYVRIQDGGLADYSGNSGGFDLDALAVIHETPL